MSPRTFIVIPASDVPPGLADFRKRHVHHPGSAVPFHTTVVFPFLPLEELQQGELARLREVAARLAPFPYAANAICTFPTTAVLWLAPSPVAQFEKCTQAIYEEFPQVRPTGGYPTYHMTIGLTQTPEELPSIVHAFQMGFSATMPMHFRARELTVYVETDARYELHSVLPMEAR